MSGGRLCCGRKYQFPTDEDKFPIYSQSADCYVNPPPTGLTAVNKYEAMQVFMHSAPAPQRPPWPTWPPSPKGKFPKFISQSVTPATRPSGPRPSGPRPSGPPATDSKVLPSRTRHGQCQTPHPSPAPSRPGRQLPCEARVMANARHRTPARHPAGQGASSPAKLVPQLMPDTTAPHPRTHPGQGPHPGPQASGCTAGRHPPVL